MGRVISRDENGKALKVIGVSQDITQRKQVEQALRENNYFMDLSQRMGKMGSWTIDLKSSISYWSENMYQLQGYLKENGVPSLENYLERIHPDDQHKAREYIYKVINTKKLLPPIEYRFIRPDTNEVVYLNVLITFLDETENVLVGVNRDITSDKKAQDALEESHAFRNSIINNAAEGLCVCHNCDKFPFVHFTVWNQQMDKITGYSLEEINRLGWYQSLYPDPEVQEKAINRMAEMRHGNDIVAEEWTIRTKSGAEKVISLSTSIIKTAGDRVYVMALITDITEKELYKKTVEQQYKELLNLNATKDKFFSIIAHDLKNPSSTMQNLSEMLLNSYELLDDEKRVKFISSIFESSRKMSMLLEDLLTWSRAQMGKIKVQPQAFNINDLVRQQLHLLSEMIERKKLKTEMVFNNKGLVYADLNSIKTILRNLLSNAIKFSHTGGRISIETSKFDKETVKIIVTDEGVGIPKKQLDNLFRIEYSETTLGTNDEKGTGLGLIISKEFLNKSNGDIWVESEVGKGSRFIFTLPSIEKAKEVLER